VGVNDRDEDFAQFRARMLADRIRAARWSSLPDAEPERCIEAIWRDELEGRRDREERRVQAIASRFPARAFEAALSADLEAPALAQLRNWSAAHGDGIAILAGAPGCGKTAAATWWALQRRDAPAFLRATELAAASRYDATARARWASAPALVLDDLGAEYSDPRGSFRVDLDELVDLFYAGKRALVITTNCGADEFRSRYGERVVDRMRECGAWLAIAGDSLRGRR
jgi:DNA replication protein DnaC